MIMTLDESKKSMRMERNHTRKPPFKKACIAIVLVIIACSILWFAVVNFKYQHYIAGMEEIYAYRTFALVSDDGYTYNVKFPSYLSLVGNLGIQKSEGSNCALIIWPKMIGETEYGVILSSEDGSGCEVMMTKDRLPAAGASEKAKQLVAAYQDEINLLYEKADAMWNLGLT